LLRNTRDKTKKAEEKLTLKLCRKSFRHGLFAKILFWYFMGGALISCNESDVHLGILKQGELKTR
jgi:hypothetical protein